jgi:acetyl-CoA acetyltransferase
VTAATTDAQAAIVGIGETAFTKESGVSDLRLSLEATKAALADAKINAHDIDGIIIPTVVGATTEDLTTNLGIENLRYHAAVVLGGAGPAAALRHAKSAIENGLASRILVCYGFNGRSGVRLGRRGPTLMFGEAPSMRRNYEGVHGLLVPAQYYALWAQRYMYENGWKSTEPMAHVAVTQSRHAVMNGKGLGAKEISVEDHQSSRMISSPFRLYDCSRETDGGAAYIVAAAEPGDRNAVAIRGAAEGHPGQADQPTTRRRFLHTGMAEAGERAFAQAGWKPSDVDFAELYDAFTFNVLWQLELLGLCGPGEAADFVMAGSTRVGGSLPVNTHGGLLSQAHLWGINHITEAVKQLRGTAGQAQVKGAKRGLVTGSGDFGDNAVVLLEGGLGE